VLEVVENPERTLRFLPYRINRRSISKLLVRKVIVFLAPLEFTLILFESVKVGRKFYEKVTKKLPSPKGLVIMGQVSFTAEYIGGLFQLQCFICLSPKFKSRKQAVQTHVNRSRSIFQQDQGTGNRRQFVGRLLCCKVPDEASTSW
jgi:hypothetical protein